MLFIASVRKVFILSARANGSACVCGHNKNMKNYIALVFLLLAGSGLAAQGYDDSLLIYQSYKQQISDLKTYSETLNYGAWIKMEDSIKSYVSPAFARLEKANHERYAPIDSLTMEGFGVAYLYPNPNSPAGDKTKVGGYSVLSRQIHFLVNSKNRTRVPFVEEWYYNKQGVVIKVVKRDPVTLQELAEVN